MNNPIVNTFFVILLVMMAVMIVLCLVRAIIGPRVADRIVATNMMGTFIIVMIAILAVKMDEGYLVDICIIYAMISFLAVVVLAKVYMGIYLQRKEVLNSRKHAHRVNEAQGSYRSSAESGKQNLQSSVSEENEAAPGSDDSQNEAPDIPEITPVTPGKEAHE